MISVFTNQLLKQFVRKFSITNTSNSSSVIECLKNKSVIKVSGEEAKDFLQGHLTNDINLFNHQPECKSLYSMILNHQGRVLYDIFLYINENSYYIECEKSILSDLMKHLQRYKLRKKVNIAIDENLVIWVSFLKNLNLCETNKPLMKESIFSDDPRMFDLCKRNIISSIKNEFPEFEQTHGLYEQLRYKNGVGEGPIDLISGNCFPLESNLDFLNGVSFDKGCYVGQELTARVHHTGVIRKRLMPLVLKEPISILPGANIENEDGKNIGKVRNFQNIYGLGLLRVSEAMKSKKLTIKDDNGVVVETTTHIPNWWLGKSDEIVKLTLKSLEKR